MSRAWRKDWQWHEPETPEERLDFACWHYVEESGFPETRVERARKRVLRGGIGPHWSQPETWVVPGDPTWGDVYDTYLVSWRGGRYTCTCFEHQWGARRQRRVCSHVLAVMLWRRMGSSEEVPTRDVPTADEGPSESRPASAEPGESVSSVSESEYGPDRDRLGWWSTPAQLGFPQFAQFRPHQKLALKQIVEAFQSGAKVVLVEAPTGSGKSLIGAAAGKILRMPVVYVSTTKQLQDQFLASFPTSRTLKGRDNYTPLNYLPPEEGCDMPGAHDPGREKVPTCDACDRSEGVCTFCHDVRKCPYTVAKQAAVYADQAVLNTAYWLLEANHAGRFSDLDENGYKEKHPDGLRLLVLDEGDTLESALMSFVQVEIPSSRLDELRIPPPKHKSPTDKVGEWGAWISDTMLPALRQHLAEKDEESAPYAEAVATHHGMPPDTIVEVGERRMQLRMAQLIYSQLRRKVKSLTRLEQQLLGMRSDLALRPKSWVRTDDGDGQKLVFKPVLVAPYAQALLWRHFSRVLVMSATILSADRFCNDLGLDKGAVATVVIPSPFPVANRLVRYVGVASMDKTDQAESMPAVAAAVNKILDLYPGERVLIHSVSYDLGRGIAARISPRHRRRIVTFERGGREEALRRYTSTPGAVLIGAGLDRGVDLPDDLTRVVVIPKIPKPSLGDRQVSARLYGFGRDGQEWYMAQTIRTLVQSTGRGVRHRDDWCVTYVLDTSFERLWREGKHLLPHWCQEAVRFETEIRREI